MVKVELSFDAFWVLTRQDDEKLPAEAVTLKLRECFDFDVLKSSFTEIMFVIKNEDIDCQTAEEIISGTIIKMYSLEKLDAAAQVKVSKYDGDVQSDDGEGGVDNKKKIEAALKSVDALVGADEFKALMHEIVKVAPGLIKHNAVEVFTHQCYIFSINQGYGLTTYLKHFCSVTEKAGLITYCKDFAIADRKVTMPQGKDQGNPFHEVVAELLRPRKEGVRILCVDISEWMSKISDKRFREFLGIVSRHLDKNIFIFKVPFVEKEVINDIKKGIGDVLQVRDISFVPFDSQELRLCAKAQFEKKGFSVKDDVWEVFDAKINEEKNDGRFYGFNTLDKVIREMIYLKMLNNAASGVDDNIVKAEEIEGLVNIKDQDNLPGLELLDTFIGMSTVKRRVEEIVAQIELSSKNEKLGAPCIHMRFVGNPGTGKTTVARLVGKVLKEKGILRNGNFFEYSGRDFCGQFIGETAPKTAAMCRDAYGSVLFIDEAYSLYRGGHDSRDYGREVIETLIAEMENHRNDLVVIMAGYPDEMQTLMGANAGLESRMPYIVEFPNYTREQLFDIFMLMVNKSFSQGEGFKEVAKEYFDNLPDEIVLSKEFSNARFVRNLFERTWGKAVLRCQLNKQECNCLTKEDFLLSSSEKEFKKIMSKPKRSLGFV